MGSDQRLLETLATVCAAMSFADGDVDPAEIAAFHLVARDLGATPSAAAKMIDSAVARVSAVGAVPEELIGEACRKLPKGNHPALFEAAVHVLVADGELANAECLRLAALAEFLDVPTAVVIASIASVVHGNPDLDISVTEAVLR
jgi:uncharacterized tellurite resistance protein B-like protein